MLLGELLLEAGAITREELDIARRNQDLYGERLGTNLVELGFITEAKLVQVLSQKHRLPAVAPGGLDAIATDVVALIPERLAAIHRVIPLRRDGDRLFIAVSDPTDTKGLAAIRDVVLLDVRWMIAADLAISNALEKYYGVARRLRPRAQPVVASASTEIDPNDLIEVDGGDSLFAPSGPEDEEPGMVAIEAPLLAEVLSGALHAHANANANAPEQRVGLSAFAHRLLESDSESGLSDATLAYLAQDFQRIIMVKLRDDRFVGWRALGGGLSDDAVRVFSVSVDEMPVCKKALDDGIPRLGIGDAMLGTLALLFAPVGNEPTLVLPVRCSGRPVACFVAVGGKEGAASRLNDFLLVARKLDLTLQILVLKKRVLE